MPLGIPTFFASAGARVISGTANRVAIFNSDGELQASDTITTTELETLDGITGSVQTQLDDIITLADGKIYIGDGTNTISEVTISGDITIDNTGVAAIAAGVIVDADVSATADITRTKLAPATANRVLINDGSGEISESASIVSDELDYLDNFVKKTNISLNDNETGPTTFLTYPATFEYTQLEYGILRGTGGRETGKLEIATNGTSVEMTQEATELGTIGVTISAIINAGNVELQYSSTSTGNAPEFDYIQRRWSN